MGSSAECHAEIARLEHKCAHHHLCRQLVHGKIVFGVGLIVTSFTLDHRGGLFCTAGLSVGVGTSLLYTATNSLPLQWFSSKSGIANGVVKAGGGVGATLLPLPAQALVHRFGLQWTFRILGILIMAAGIPCTLALKDRAIPGSLSRFDWSLLKNVPFLTLTMVGAVEVFVLFVPLFFLPLYASSIGLSASPGAELVGGFGAATAVGRILGGWMCDKIGTSNTSMITVWSTRSVCWRFGLSARHYRRYSFSLSSTVA
jgi:nitrate/nitrite transporter NarK